MEIIAWLLVGIAIINIVAGPFYIGKAREPFSGTSYLINLVIAVAMFAVAGRVLGWW